MEFSNEGQSFYHRFQGSFFHDWNRKLLHCTTSQGSNVKSYQASHGVQCNGSAVLTNNHLHQPTNTAFEEFFMQLILDQADLCAKSESLPTPETESRTQQIVDLFDSYLRYQGKNDRWVHGGRTYFAERVRHFTTQNATIELCLPAFPCKSSNRDKVTGTAPDRGEELALERLHGFVEAIEEIYQPGAKLWIISDGHVFSDCIGVDDADVDAYGQKLKEMNHAIGVRRGNDGRIGFKSLVDLFHLAAVGSDGEIANLAHRLNIPNIDHHVKTKVTEEAELCRRILMAGCGPHKSAVRAKVDSKDAAITALYRGFSRFMLEDLERHPHTERMSRSQQRKLSSKVAFEMILRNQAYSNLVEMLFPNHVRLSIHAHNNAGPKFGIQLFDPARVRAVETLSPDGQLMASLDLLHIPTPWHNSVVRLEGSDVVLVTKAKLARAALDRGTVVGGLVGGADAEGRAAYFALSRKGQEVASVPVPVGVPPAPTFVAEPEVVKVKTEKDKASTVVAVTAVAVDEPESDDIAPRKLQKRATFSEKTDTVVTGLVRRNTIPGLEGSATGFCRLPGQGICRWSRTRARVEAGDRTYPPFVA